MARPSTTISAAGMELRCFGDNWDLTCTIDERTHLVGLALEPLGSGRHKVYVKLSMPQAPELRVFERGQVLGWLQQPPGLGCWRWMTSDGGAGTKLRRDKALFCVAARAVQQKAAAVEARKPAVHAEVQVDQVAATLDDA